MRFFRKVFLFLTSLVLLVSLSSCSRGENVDPVGGIIEYKVDDENSSLINYYVRVYNITNYNIENVSFDIELFNGESSVLVLKKNQSLDVRVDHNRYYDISDSFEKTVEFDSIRLTNCKYTSQSFTETYLYYLIIVPIAIVTISLALGLYIIKHAYELNPNAKMSSIVLLISVLVLGMGNQIGWISSGFVFGGMVSTYLICMLIFKYATNKATAAKNAAKEESNESPDKDESVKLSEESNENKEANEGDNK